MDITLTPNHLTECARIYFYFGKEGANFFVMNCLFCNKEYSDWLLFYNHLCSHSKRTKECKTKSDYFENGFNLQQLKKNPFQECEAKCKSKSGYLKNGFHLQHLKEIPSKECEAKNQYLEKDSGYSAQADNVFSHTEEEFLEVEYLKEYFDEYEKLSVNIKDVDEEKSPEPITTCFFRLYTTDSKVMLKFIDLLRLHPCQWDHKNYNFTHKDRRFDSTLKLTKQLKKHFNLNITPQGTRASVLSLLRWFDREYIRFLHCQQNDYQFVGLHSEYFERLLEFLPYQHLKPMKCNECSKHFKSEHLLMAHKHKYHNGQVPFRCRYCGHGFIHQSSHKMHENRHVKIHVWPCNICLYQAASKSDYIKHLATHSSQQPHKCKICGLSYKTKTNLNVHLKSHSLPAYECEFCRKKFYEKYRYKRHIWLHEEHEVSGKSIDNFTCEICGRRFTSNKTLMKHQLVHIQENYKVEGETSNCYKLIDVIVYNCDYCYLEFLHKEAYETHMELKHNVIIK